MERPVNPLPPACHARLHGHEVTVELTVASYAAHYLRELHHPPAEVDPVVSPEDPPYLVEGWESPPSRVSSKAGCKQPEDCPVTGAQEVLVHLLLQAHVPDHRHLLRLSPFCLKRFTKSFQ